MADPINVCADMALAEIGILHIAQLVLAEFGARHRGEAGQNGLAEARSEQRNAVGQRVCHRRHDTGLDLGGRGLRNRRRNTIGRTGLIVGTERRRRDERLAIRLRRGGRRLHQQRQGRNTDECR